MLMTSSVKRKRVKRPVDSRNAVHEMDTSPIEVEKTLRKDLRDRIKQVTGSLTTGSTSDFVCYLAFLKRNAFRWSFMRSFS